MEKDLNTPETAAKCPVAHDPRRHTAAGSAGNAEWWPNQLNLKILHQHSPLSDPMDKDFNYAEEFKTLDLDSVVKDLAPVRVSRGALTRPAWELAA